MHLEKLLTVIDGYFPHQTAIEGDRIGLQIQSGKTEITSILITIEVNDDVIDYAEEESIDCIITFHPLIYHPLANINFDERVGRLCSRLIKNSISLIVVHTNFDSFPEGTSKIFANKLGIKSLDVLIHDSNNANFGMGIIGEFEIPIVDYKLIQKVSELCSSPVRYCTGKNKLIKKVGIIGGSGTSFFSQINISALDAFITADITYHTFQQYNNRVLLIDPGHYEMEQFVPEGIYNSLNLRLKQNGIKKILLNNRLTNPTRYYPGGDIYKLKQENYLLKFNIDGA